MQELSGDFPQIEREVQLYEPGLSGIAGLEMAFMRIARTPTLGDAAHNPRADETRETQRQALP